MQVRFFRSRIQNGDSWACNLLRRALRRSLYRNGESQAGEEKKPSKNIFSKVELQPNLAESLDVQIILQSLPNLEAGKPGFSSLSPP